MGTPVGLAIHQSLFKICIVQRVYKYLIAIRRYCRVAEWSKRGQTHCTVQPFGHTYHYWLGHFQNSTKSVLRNSLTDIGQMYYDWWIEAREVSSLALHLFSAYQLLRDRSHFQKDLWTEGIRGKASLKYLEFPVQTRSDLDQRAAHTTRYELIPLDTTNENWTNPVP